MNTCVLSGALVATSVKVDRKKDPSFVAFSISTKNGCMEVQEFEREVEVSCVILNPSEQAVGRLLNSIKRSFVEVRGRVQYWKHGKGAERRVASVIADGETLSVVPGGAFL